MSTVRCLYLGLNEATPLKKSELMPPAILSSEAIREKKKLLANSLDRASTACLTLGIFGPLAAAYFGFPGTSITLLKFSVGAGCWGLAALALHHSAQLILNDLK